MRKLLTLTFFLHVFFIKGQTSSLDWADYYYVNGNYAKAIKLYSQSLNKLDIDQERNLAYSYMGINLNSEAQSIFRDITNDNQSGIVDYLTFAQLLPKDSKLAKEYREKAKRLYLHQTDPLEGDSIIYKSRFYNSNSLKLKPFPNNTNEDEFSAIMIPKDFDATDHFGDKNQIKFYYVNSKKFDGESKKLKRIKSNSTIYNISDAKMDTVLNKIITDTLLPKGINTHLQEGPVCFIEQMNKLLITRNISSIDSDKKYQLNIYQVNYNSSGSNIDLKGKPIFELKSNYSNMHPTYDSSTGWLYFSSDMPGGYGGMDLYRVQYKEDGVLGEPENMGNDINTSFDEVFPYSYSEDVLFFSSNRKLGLGKLDPVIATRVIDNRWSIEALGAPFSSEADDFGFYLDSKTKLGFISSNRDGGKGKDDNYHFVSKPKVKGLDDKYIFGSDTLVKSFNGVLKNDEILMLAEDPLNSLVSREVVVYQTTDAGTLNLEKNGSFWYIPNNPQVKKDSFSYYLETSYSKSKIINVYLEREELGLDLNHIFRPIYFEFDSADIWTKYKDRIDEIINALKLYPNMTLKVKAYTDNRGTDEYNLELSERRAASIVEYIKLMVENNERLSSQGYGESTIIDKKPIEHIVKSWDTKEKFARDYGITVSELENLNPKIKYKLIVGETIRIPIKFTEEDHQLERRVEFEIINFNY